MKILFIGGTGNISSAVSRLAINRGVELYHLNRGNRQVNIPGIKTIIGDITNPLTFENELAKHTWDTVVNWIAFTEQDIERDIKLFTGKTKQYIFISSASVYQKPLAYPVITESTPQCNPFSDYARNKIACEDRLNKAYRKDNFPITIVRPSHTYDTYIPIAFGGGPEYTIVDRILKGKKIICHGDGKSLWTETHADDFAKGILGLFGNDHAMGHTFHITSDEILNWDQIYNTIAAAVGKKASIIHIASDFICKCDPSLIGTLIGDKSESVIFDTSKIKRFVPDYKATISFKEGIQRTLAWFDAHPEKKLIRKETNDTVDRIIGLYEK